MDSRIIGNFEAIDSGTFSYRFRWREDVTYVILGQSGYPMDVTSPFTQIVRVDCMHTPVNPNNNTNVILLHLSEPITYSRAVLPTFLQNT